MHVELLICKVWRSSLKKEAIIIPTAARRQRERKEGVASPRDPRTVWGAACGADGDPGPKAQSLPLSLNWKCCDIHDAQMARSLLSRFLLRKAPDSREGGWLCSAPLGGPRQPGEVPGACRPSGLRRGSNFSILCAQEKSSAPLTSLRYLPSGGGGQKGAAERRGFSKLLSNI